MRSPGYDAKVADNVPYLDVAGVRDAEGGTLTFFAVNRHASEAIDMEVSLEGFGAARVVDHQEMAGFALEAANTLKAPDAVTPKAGSGAAVKDGVLTARLKPHSYQMIRTQSGLTRTVKPPAKARGHRSRNIGGGRRICRVSILVTEATSAPALIASPLSGRPAPRRSEAGGRFCILPASAKCSTGCSTRPEVGTIA